MGLDLIAEGCAKPGHEQELRDILGRSFAGDTISAAEMARFQAISVPASTRAGAPRVGTDAAADAWIIDARKAQTPDEVAATLEQFAGQYVLRLAKCDGVPAYSNAGLYAAVDETSFRGEFLKSCADVIDERLLNAAWEHKFPEAAVAYGRALLAAADAAERRAPADQLKIVRAAGRWFVFWGERGHAIRAYF